MEQFIYFAASITVVSAMKQALFSLACTCLLATFSFAQSSGIKVHTEDIDRFWTAYDSARTTNDSLQQLHFIKTLYTEKASAGLKAFMEVRRYTPELYVNLIRSYPRYWNSIRPKTLQIRSIEHQFGPSIQQFKNIYPGLKPVEIYFLIGGMRSGGTTKDSLVLIGAELSTGDTTVDLSDFSPSQRSWLAGIFKNQRLDNLIPLNIHEVVHTQQKESERNLLTASIMEGSCDFISYLVTGKTVNLPYMHYGAAHEPALKKRFEEQMYFPNYQLWLYNGRHMVGSMPGDLGYYMGYAIAKSYYQHAKNKEQAIREIIELYYPNEDSVESFLKRSKYFRKWTPPSELLARAAKKAPVVTAVSPFNNGDTLVDAATSQLTIHFSAPMNTGNYSILLGPGGEEQFPLSGLPVFAQDKKSVTLSLKLKPGQPYECIFSGRAFLSADGYPLKDFLLRFRTKP